MTFTFRYYYTSAAIIGGLLASQHSYSVSKDLSENDRLLRAARDGVMGGLLYPYIFPVYITIGSYIEFPCIYRSLLALIEPPAPAPAPTPPPIPPVVEPAAGAEKVAAARARELK